jgi:hypothetical protein
MTTIRMEDVMVDFSDINYWAVVVVWLVYVGVGSFWYSPAGFGKRWSKLSGVNIMKLPQDEANRAIIYVAASSLLQAFALALVLNAMGVVNAVQGIISALWLWAGMVAATTIGTTFYARKSWAFWWLNASFFLVTMVITGAILGMWQ